MSIDDVYPYEMNEPHDFDDNAAETLLSGGGHDVDPRLADLVGDLRSAFTSAPPALGAELSVLLGTIPPARTRSFVSRRFEQIRASMIARIGVGAAAVVVATGGLAAAGALPARVKNAVSHLGITTPAHHGSDSPPAGHTTTTTTAGATENRRGYPSRATRNASTDRCQSAAENSSLNGSCSPATTIADGATPARPDDSGGDRTDGATPTTTEPETTPTSATGGKTDTNDDITPTTTEPKATPTTVDNSEADPNSPLSANTGPISSDDTKPSPMGDN